MAPHIAGLAWQGRKSLLGSFHFAFTPRQAPVWRLTRPRRLSCSWVPCKMETSIGANLSKSCGLHAFASFLACLWRVSRDLSPVDSSPKNLVLARLIHPHYWRRPPNLILRWLLPPVKAFCSSCLDQLAIVFISLRHPPSFGIHIHVHILHIVSIYGAHVGVKFCFQHISFWRS